MLKDYPVSIAVNDLKIVYNNYDRLIDSPFYFYSLSRGFKIDKHCEENENTWNKYFSEIIHIYLFFFRRENTLCHILVL